MRQTFLARYRRRGVLLDSNLLLLLFVGKAGRAIIPRFKRTRGYRPGDFDLLDAFVGKFSRIVTTPNILTEVSNLGGALYGNWLADFREVFAQAVAASAEKQRASRLLVASAIFHTSGLADAAMIHIARGGKYLLLSDDSALRRLAARENIDALGLADLHAADFLNLPQTDSPL